MVHAFERGVDVLNLAGIDANSAAAGNQAFDYVGGAAFSGAGDLRYAGGVLSGDVNGDGTGGLPDRDRQPRAVDRRRT